MSWIGARWELYLGNIGAIDGLDKIYIIATSEPDGSYI